MRHIILYFSSKSSVLTSTDPQHYEKATTLLKDLFFVIGMRVPLTSVQTSSWRTLGRGTEPVHNY
jgi:hypothetical protein